MTGKNKLECAPSRVGSWLFSDQAAQRTNTLAYFLRLWVTEIKGFKGLALFSKFRKPFTFITDDRAKWARILSPPG
jgi:hypothetical protein